MDLEKLKKDRKLLRGIDSHVVSRSTLIAFAYFFVYGLVGWWGELFERAPRFMTVLGVFLVLPMVWRAYCALRFEQTYGAAPTRWRQSFMLVHIIHVVMYATLCFLAIVLIENPILQAFLTLLTVGLVLLSAEVWRPFRRINEAFSAICLLPFVVGALLQASLMGLLIAAVLCAIFVNHLWVLKRSYDEYWWGLYHNFLIKEKTKDLETAERKIRRMGEGRIDLLSDLTHEIRTPMNSVLGMLTLLLDSGLDESQKEIVTVAHHSGDSMLTLIDDILDFSRIASGSIVLVSSVFNLRHCIDETLELLGPVAHAKGIELSSVYDGDVPVRVRGDAHRIGQILNNLVSNAIKFSDEGEVAVTVHMTRLSGEEGLLRVHVIDQGVGISADKQDELFRAFHKADASTTRKHGGTGLGLAISKGLVEAMQGQIGLISDVGKGSTFWFTCQLMLSTQQVASLPAKCLE
jgi:signal transduction histidine kinase